MPMQTSDQHKLCMKIKGMYYVDQVLPMGLSSSCSLFESFSTALEDIFSYYAPYCNVLHYLDDFLFITESEDSCLTSLNVFKNLCDNIGIPVSPGKNISFSMYHISWYRVGFKKSMCTTAGR